jgi:hypothetical protein
MKREILPIQQTQKPILSNYINIEAQPIADVIYFNWTLYNDDAYVNNGSFIIFGEDIDLYNADNEFMWEYVGVQLKLTYV